MIKFKIATPERVILETEVESLTLPTQMGEITVLQNHVPLVGNLKAGEIKYQSQGKQEFFAVSGGVIEVKSTRGGSAFGGKNSTEVIVLADTAEFGHEIDVQRAEEARERAQKLMTETVLDQEKFAEAAAMLEKNLARLRVAHKHRTHKHPHIES